MDDKLIENIHIYLRTGRVKEALDDLYNFCRYHSRRHLEEVISHITKLELLNGSDRAGLISFEEKIRLESQISSSVLKLLVLLEDGNSTLSNKQINDSERIKLNLDIEREKRLEAENRLLDFEKAVNKKPERNITKKVRDHITGNRIELKIIALSHSVSSENNYAIVFKEELGERRLPIVIGTFEAQAIAVSIENMIPSRPLTHDFFKAVVEELNFNLKEVYIDALEKGIFYSKAIFINESSHIEIDCRTADAIALALRFKVPIYTLDYIMKAAGIVLDDNK